jgi:ankyrin repeat protein
VVPTSNIKLGLGVTALLIASHHNNVDVAQLLLDHGANMEHEDNDGSTALFIALNRKKNLILLDCW